MDSRAIVAIVVVAVVVGAFLLLNSSGPTEVASPTGQTIATSTPEEIVEESPEEVEEAPREPNTDNFDELPLARLEEVEGDCTLMYSVSSRRYGCYGCAGEICTVPDSRWSLASTDKYFCKAMEDGCKLYQKVELNR